MHLAGIKMIWKQQSDKAQAMSTTQGNLSSPTPMINVEDKPDHLLVLVHGIMGRYAHSCTWNKEIRTTLSGECLEVDPNLIV